MPKSLMKNPQEMLKKRHPEKNPKHAGKMLEKTFFMVYHNNAHFGGVAQLVRALA